MNFKHETKSLIMRVCNRRDARLVHSFYMNNLKEFMRYEPLDPISATSLFYYEKLLEVEYNLMLEQKLFRFFLFEKHNPLTIVGTVSFRNIEQAPHMKSCQTGYKIDAAYRRMGYASEAISAGCRLMFDEQKLHRIEALILPENKASCKLAESLGFKNEGLMRQKILLNRKWRDHYLYSLLSTDPLFR